MSGLVGTLGSKYVFRVAAYLDSNELALTQGYNIDFRGFDLNPYPQTIRRSLSALHHAVSVDLIAAKGESEYFVEAKHSEEPKPVRKNSKEFKESIVEFVALEKYRKTSMRNVQYIFLTNAPTGTLRNQVDELKLGSRNELIKYSGHLTRAARQKWKGECRDVQAGLVKSVLNRLLLITLVDASLDAAAEEINYRDSLSRILADHQTKHGTKVSSANELPIISLTTRSKVVRVAISRGYELQISTTIISQLRRLVHENLVSSATRFGGDVVSFLNSMKFECPGQRLNCLGVLNHTLNELTGTTGTTCQNFLVLSVVTREIELISKKWLDKISKSHTDMRNRFIIDGVAKEFPNPISSESTITAITELKRMNGYVIDSGWFVENP
jgi:hypothetical protein